MAIKVKAKGQPKGAEKTDTPVVVSKKEKQPELPSWKLVGGKPLTLFTGEVIQPGTIFQARGKDIPKGFMNVLEAIPVVVLKEAGESTESKTNVAKNPAKNDEANKPAPEEGDEDAKKVNDEGGEGDKSNDNPGGPYTYKHEKSGWYLIYKPDGTLNSEDKFREGQAKKIVDELNFSE